MMRGERWIVIGLKDSNLRIGYERGLWEALRARRGGVAEEVGLYEGVCPLYSAVRQDVRLCIMDHGIYTEVSYIQTLSILLRTYLSGRWCTHTYRCRYRYFSQLLFRYRVEECHNYIVWWDFPKTGSIFIWCLIKVWHLSIVLLLPYSLPPPHEDQDVFWV